MKKFKLLSFLGSILMALSLVSCNTPSTSSSSQDNLNRDFVSEVKFTGTFKNKSFLSDGVGIVTLKKGVDGDTSHFYQGHTFLAGRYNGIDTPESTGIIEPWGKKAAAFTNSKLEEAKTIVLETEAMNQGPEQDGNNRYLVWVWISNRTNAEEDGTQLKLLNLMLVQEGLAKSSGVSTSRYKDAFIDCDYQAQQKKIGVWSKSDPDFDYSGEYTSTTLEHIMSAPDTWVDKKVEFEAVVSRTINTDAYVQMDFEQDDGTTKTYGIYIFTQYKSRECLSMGNKLLIKGQMATYNGNYQIVDVSYNALLPTKKDMKIISTGHNVEPMEVTIPDVQGVKEKIGVLVKLEGLTGTGGYGGTDAGAETNGITVYCKDEDGNKLNIRIDKGAYIRDENGDRIKTYEYFKGKTFDVTGIMGIYESQYDNETEYQLMLIATSDIVIKK